VTSRLFPLALAGLVLSGCTSPPPKVEWNAVVEEVPSPAEGVSAVPQLTVGAGRTILSWLESRDFRETLKYSEWTDAGWSEPVTIVSQGGMLHNAADVPSVLALDGGRLAAAWLETDMRHAAAYNLSLAWSDDDGKTWSAAARPHHDGTPSQHGFGSLFGTPQGFGIVWLDGRHTDPNLPEGENGNMALWAAGFGPGGEQAGELEVDGRVCDCCQTSAAVTTDGPIVVYRDRSDKEIRDIAVTRLSAGKWSAPAVVHQDGWKINGCPVNGPAVAAHDRRVVVAWFTGATETGEVFAAFSEDSGRTFGRPIKVNEGEARGQVDVELLADGSAVVAWREFLDEGSQLRARRVGAAGGTSPPVTVTRVSGPHYSRMALHGDHELVFAWVEAAGGYSRIRTARARF
jgi:hypothetical protein